MPDKDEYDTLRVTEIVWETPESLTLTFDVPSGNFQYNPGQYITLVLNIEGKQEKRYFSLTSSPHTDPYPSITVKKTINGKSSWLFFQQISPGTEFEFLTPAGEFSPQLDVKHAYQYVFFAGGSGITPLMSMIKSILHKEPNSGCTLVYQNRNEDSIIFKQPLQKLEEINRGRFRVIHILSQPNPSWPGRRGRIKSPVIADVLTDIPKLHMQHGHYYICGPKGMEKTVTKSLKFLGIPGTNIRLESY